MAHRSYRFFCGNAFTQCFMDPRSFTKQQQDATTHIHWSLTLHTFRHTKKKGTSSQHITPCTNTSAPHSGGRCLTLPSLCLPFGGNAFTQYFMDPQSFTHTHIHTAQTYYHPSPLQKHLGTFVLQVKAFLAIPASFFSILASSSSSCSCQGPHSLTRQRPTLTHHTTLCLPLSLSLSLLCNVSLEVIDTHLCTPFFERGFLLLLLLRR